MRNHTLSALVLSGLLLAGCGRTPTATPTVTAAPATAEAAASP